MNPRHKIAEQWTLESLTKQSNQSNPITLFDSFILTSQQTPAQGKMKVMHSTTEEVQSSSEVPYDKAAKVTGEDTSFQVSQFPSRLNSVPRSQSVFFTIMTSFPEQLHGLSMVQRMNHFDSFSSLSERE